MRQVKYLAIGAVLALAGCQKGCNDPSIEDAGVVDAGPRELSEKEPNNKPEDALVLDSNSLVSANLGTDPSKMDEDWYALTAANPSSADVTVGGIPGTDVVLEVFDTDRNRVMAVNSQGQGKSERLPNLAVRGKLFLRVAATKKGTGGGYTLAAMFQEAPPGFEQEPNDRAADANSLPLGTSISGFIGHAGDEDWYRFDIQSQGAPMSPELATTAELDAGETVQPAPPSGTAPVAANDGEDAGTPAGAAPPSPAAAPPEIPKIALKIDVSALEEVKLDVTVMSEAQAALFQVKGKDNEPLSLRNIGVRATDRVLYVVVKSAWSGTGKDAKRGFNAQQPYQLTVTQEEGSANAEQEPNDELVKATPLPPDGFRDGFLSPTNDLDYFVLRTNGPALARIQVSGVDRLDTVLTMVKPSDGPGSAEQVLIKTNDGLVKEPEILNNVSCPGECYFQISGAQRKGPDGKMVRDYENAEMPYRIAATVVPDNGSEEREPNNALEAATPVALGQPVRGTVHPKRDSDYFKLDLSGRPVRTPIKATALGILKVDLGLYLHRIDDETEKLTLVQTSDKAKGEAPEIIRFSAEPGVYIFEVRDAKNRESNFQDSYQLTVEEGE